MEEDLGTIYRYILIIGWQPTGHFTHVHKDTGVIRMCIELGTEYHSNKRYCYLYSAGD